MAEFIGRWAMARENFLQQTYPKVYAAMAEEGYLEKHLGNVQKACSEYVNERMEKLRKSKEYLETAEKDYGKAIKMITTEQAYAESDAGLLWIYTQEEDEEDEEENLCCNCYDFYDEYDD